MTERESEEAHSHPAGSHLPLLYRMEGEHWWSRGMRRIALSLLEKLFLPPGAVLEMGCGGGRFLAELRRRYPGRLVCGLDLRWDALAQARRRQAEVLIQTDARRIPLAEESCSLIVALDVFDQSGVELEQAILACASLLRPGGCLLLRVSALSWLASPHDTAFGTGRRYHIQEVRRALQAAALSPLRLTHANSLLLPLTAAHRSLQQMGLVETDSALRPDGLWNGLWYSILATEAALLQHRDLPIGSSLLCLARRG